MPLAWFKALAQPDRDTPFADDDYLSSFRIVPQAGKLPVGFAVDDGSDTHLTVSKLRWFTGQGDREKWIGLNCAACHTAVIEYGGTENRIDGGPSLFDYQRFIEALDTALRQTLVSAGAAGTPAGARFDSFARKVLCGSPAECAADTPANRDLLRAALDQLVAWEDRVAAMNRTSSRYGFGRVDAFGHIYNKVALFTGATAPTPNPPSAPVSYPFLWDIYRQDYLQWNGSAQRIARPIGKSEFDFGALGRNAGEVIGVFGDVRVPSKPGLGGLKSSINIANIERLERLLYSLKAPKWPAAFGAGAGDVAAGKALFDVNCKSCHAPQPGTAPYKVTLVPLTRGNPNNTDPWMACNAVRYKSAPGNLQGLPEGYIGEGARYTDAPAPLVMMLETTVKGALLADKGEILLQIGRVYLGIGGLPHVVNQMAMVEKKIEADPVVEGCFDMKSDLFRYKARPLDGIWATAPYLHNGSVANLYELLLPPAKRATRFYVGTRRFDPEKVGYRTDAAAPGNSFEFDTTKPGNSNEGHDFGASKFSGTDRQNLLAYLKTL